MKIQFHIGSDISAKTLDFCVRKEGKIILEEQIQNNEKSIHRFFKKLKEIGVDTDNSWFCAEHTGRYGYKLRLALEQFGFTYSMLPALEIMRSVGIQRGKNDKVDADRIAEYCMRFEDKLTPSMIAPEYIVELKELYTFRKLQVKHRTALYNYQKTLKLGLKTAANKLATRETKKSIKSLSDQIDMLEKEITAIINKHDELKQNYKLVTSVPGIGLLSAAYMIICTENFVQFTDARKFASYIGVAPFPHQSGSSINKNAKTSKLGNQEMKTLLRSGISSIIGGKSELAVYYNRKIKEGKHKNKVKNAVIFKLLGRAFATVKRQSPHVQLTNHLKSQ